MRYSVIGATIQQVRSVGGKDIKEARHSKIIFTTLTMEQSKRLIALGCNVNLIGKVKATVIAPPVPVAGAPVYTPEELLEYVGLEDLRAMMRPLLYGSGMNLAIIDSGIRKTHEKISGRVIYEKNFTTDVMADNFDHGTGVCSVAVAVAPLCNILNLKVLNSEGEGYEEDVVLAIDHCVDLQETNPSIAPSVINLSLGAPDDGNPNNVMRTVCRMAIANGIWVISSAGNSGPDFETITSPACERYVAAVGSASYDPFQISLFSSRGPTKEGLVKPDMVMFGEDIVMASSSSDTATIAKSGTSFATPFVSGTGILFHEGIVRYGRIMYVGEIPIGSLPVEIAGLITTEEMMDVWVGRACAKPVNAPLGKDNDYGYGIPYGPLVASAVGAAPAVLDITSMLGPIMLIGMMGVLIVPMGKAMEQGI